MRTLIIIATLALATGTARAQSLRWPQSGEAQGSTIRATGKTPTLAPFAGKVVRVNAAATTTIVIDHGSGYLSTIASPGKPIARVGQRVATSEPVIAVAGRASTCSLEVRWLGAKQTLAFQGRVVAGTKIPRAWPGLAGLTPDALAHAIASSTKAKDPTVFYKALALAPDGRIDGAGLRTALARAGVPSGDPLSQVLRDATLLAKSGDRIEFQRPNETTTDIDRQDPSKGSMTFQTDVHFRIHVEHGPAGALAWPVRVDDVGGVSVSTGTIALDLRKIEFSVKDGKRVAIVTVGKSLFSTTVTMPLP